MDLQISVPGECTSYRSRTRPFGPQGLHHSIKADHNPQPVLIKYLSISAIKIPNDLASAAVYGNEFRRFTNLQLKKFLLTFFPKGTYFCSEVVPSALDSPTVETASSHSLYPGPACRKVQQTQHLTRHGLTEPPAGGTSSVSTPHYPLFILNPK